MPDTMLASAPACGACANAALVQWRRRSADDPMHTVAVYGCGAHAISLAAAGQVHQATCSAPSIALAPACDCTPEPLPPPDPVPGSNPTTTLPTGWVVPAQTT